MEDPKKNADIAHMRKNSSEESSRSIIVIEKLNKYFDNKAAVKDLTIEVRKGEVLGPLGPNGAGKTTTMRILTTVLKKDSGKVTIDGIPLEYDVSHSNIRSIRKNIGFMPEFPGVYDDLLVEEYLDFFARAFYIDDKMRPFAIKEAMEIAGITDLKSREIESLSRVMKQRLALARALLHNPKILLLDEPAAGLDPRSRVELRDIIKGLKKQGKTIIVSSHILEDIQDFCDRVAIIEEGVLKSQEKVIKISGEEADEKTCRIIFFKQREEGKNYLSSLPQVKNLVWEGDKLKFSFTGSKESLAALHKELILKDLEILSFYSESPSLEEYYLSKTEAKTMG